MDDLVYAPLADLVTILLATLASGAFTIAGLLVERDAVQNILTGHSALGFWELWMGAIILFVGLYLLGYRIAWRRFEGLRQLET